MLQKLKVGDSQWERKYNKSKKVEKEGKELWGQLLRISTVCWENKQKIVVGNWQHYKVEREEDTAVWTVAAVSVT